MNGQIRDTGQKVLQSSFRTGSSNTPSYFQIFLLIVFLEKAVIISITIIQRINYTILIIICINLLKPNDIYIYIYIYIYMYVVPQR